MSLFDKEPIRTVRIYCDCTYEKEGTIVNGVFDFDIIADAGHWSIIKNCSNPDCHKAKQIHHFPVKKGAE